MYVDSDGCTNHEEQTGCMLVWPTTTANSTLLASQHDACMSRSLCAPSLYCSNSKLTLNKFVTMYLHVTSTKCSTGLRTQQPLTMAGLEEKETREEHERMSHDGVEVFLPWGRGPRSNLAYREVKHIHGSLQHALYYRMIFCLHK